MLLKRGRIVFVSPFLFISWISGSINEKYVCMYVWSFPPFGDEERERVIADVSFSPSLFHFRSSSSFPSPIWVRSSSLVKFKGWMDVSKRERKELETEAPFIYSVPLYFDPSFHYLRGSSKWDLQLCCLILLLLPWSRIFVLAQLLHVLLSLSPSPSWNFISFPLYSHSLLPSLYSWI